jgi:hypothetical protein
VFSFDYGRHVNVLNLQASTSQSATPIPILSDLHDTAPVEVHCAEGVPHRLAAATEWNGHIQTARAACGCEDA